jgi:serine O-acetyltransferase
MTDLTAAPIVGDGVDIGAGAMILGSITLGNHCKIGANAIVLRDVPAHATAVSMPAAIVPKD